MGVEQHDAQRHLEIRIGDDQALHGIDGEVLGDINAHLLQQDDENAGGAQHQGQGKAQREAREVGGHVDDNQKVALRTLGYETRDGIGAEQRNDDTVNAALKRELEAVAEALRIIGTGEDVFKVFKGEGLRRLGCERR